MDHESTPRTPAQKPRRDWYTFDRTDRWALVGLLTLVSLAATWAWLVGPLVAWARGDAIPLELTSTVSVPELEAVGAIPGPGTYDVMVPDPDTGQRLLGLAPGLVHLVVVVGTCWLVWRLMCAIAAGDPFHPSNAVRLRVIAGLLILGTAVATFLDLAARGALTATIDTGDLDPGAALVMPWLPMVTGMVAALLAEAFRGGSRLRDDVDGLV